MARNPDPHPDPNDPKQGPAPKFPPGLAPTRTVTPPRPGIVTPEQDETQPARDPSTTTRPTRGAP